MNLVQMSLTAGILIIGIILFRFLFVNRVPKKAMILLWEIAILRLVIPVAFPLPFPGIGDLGAITVDDSRMEAVEDAFISIAPGMGRHIVAKGSKAALSEGGELSEETTMMEDADNGAAYAVEVILDKSYLPWMIYGMVALAMALGSLYLYFRDSQFFREGLPMSEREKQLLLLLLEEKDRKRMEKVRFCISDRTATPVTYGIFRPAIIFPKGIYQNSEREITFWLRHELVHIRHHDNLKKMAAHGVLCLHWFNPLVWLMVLLCDETVVRKRQESRKDYALALLSMAEQKSIGFQTGLGFGKNAVTERITAVMKYKKMTIRGILGGGAAIVIALTAFGSQQYASVSYAATSQMEYTDDTEYADDVRTAEYVVTADTVQEGSGAGAYEVVNVVWEDFSEGEFSFAVTEDVGDVVTAVEGVANAAEETSIGSVDESVQESGQISEETAESIENIIGEYREFGLSIKQLGGDYQLYYEDIPIYFFADNTIPEEEGFSGRLFLRPASERNGKSGVITQYDQEGELVGVKLLSEEESETYTRRWR